MLRLLFLLLLLANVLFFAWSHGMLAAVGFAPASQREPQRMNNQIRPELVQVLPSSAAIPPAAAPDAVTPTTAATVTASAETSSAAATIGQCLQAGPFDAAQTERLRRALEEWPLQAWQFEAMNQPGRWIVYMGKYANNEASARKVAELRQLSVEPVPLENASLQPGISLGSFDDPEQARARLTELTRKGVRTARVLQERPPIQGQMLKLPQVDDALQARVSALRPALAGKNLAACGV